MEKTNRIDTVPVDSITVDAGVQLRASVNEFVVDDYAQAFAAGAEFPAIVVFRDGETLYLADGFHRYEAAKRAGLETLRAEIRTGIDLGDVAAVGRRAALLYAAGANETHGLKRSAADKEKAVRAMLEDEEWGGRSDRWIATATRVSPTFVGKVRSTVHVDSSGPREGRDGKVRTLPKTTLDEETRDLIRETLLVSDHRELHNLSRIGDLKERHEVARRIRDGHEATVQLARRTVRHARTMESSLEIKGKHFVIYADPPWHYQADRGRGCAEDEYPTMTQEELLALPVEGWAQDSAVLFMWSTNSHLEEAMPLMSRWGFSYRTNFVWVKPKITRFRYFHKAKHELLLLGTRGTGLLPPGDQLVDSVIQAVNDVHSKKPNEVYEIIERYYPKSPKLELFARTRREGWTVFSNELVAEESA